MTKCTAPALPFPRCQRRHVQAEFTSGDLTRDGGVLLLRQVDKRLGLLAAVDRVLSAPRDPRLIVHSQLSLLRQRVYKLCLGYEDLNDHTTLRTDVALQTALERTVTLASAATQCRLENRANRSVMWRLHEVLVEQFSASFDTPPMELILDFDRYYQVKKLASRNFLLHREFCSRKSLQSLPQPSKPIGLSTLR